MRRTPNSSRYMSAVPRARSLRRMAVEGRWPRGFGSRMVPRSTCRMSPEACPPARRIPSPRPSYASNPRCDCWIDSVKLRVSLPHLAGLPGRCFDLNQRPLAHSRTVMSSLVPFPAALHQLGPERKNAALGRLGGMDGAAIFPQKMARAGARRSQPPPLAGAVNVPPLEGFGGQFQKLRHPLDVSLRQVDETLLPATGRASRLAFEPQTLGHRFIVSWMGAHRAPVILSCKIDPWLSVKEGNCWLPALAYPISACPSWRVATLLCATLLLKALPCWRSSR